ncbi:hypothetical protein EJB05_49549, partial [Eragrostis curvula]
MAITSAVVAVVLVLLATAAATPAPVGRAGCSTSCGNVSVPFPFGFGSPECYWPGFNLTCDDMSGPSPPRLLLGDGTLRVAEISLRNTTVRVIRKGSAMDGADITTDRNVSFGGSFMDYGYRVSSGNELVLSGCNLLATLREDLGPGKSGIISGCAAFCSFRDKKKNSVGQPTGKYCSGMACCQAPINYLCSPTGVQLRWLDTGDHREELTFLPAYVFVAEEGWFDQRPLADELLSVKQRPSTAALEVPLLLQWGVKQGLPKLPDWPVNTTMEQRKSCPGDAYRKLCESEQSLCVARNIGYACQCQDGYEGNPYLAHGCQVEARRESEREISHRLVLELASLTPLIYFLEHRISTSVNARMNMGASANVSTQLVATDASVREELTATTPSETAASSLQLQHLVGTRVYVRERKLLQLHAKVASTYTFAGFSIGIGVSSAAGFMLLVLVGIYMTKRFKHRREERLKKRFFKQNRGQLLQQLVSQRADIAERMIIPVDELATATNHFDKARELGGGGHGTVYKGILSDLRVVAIKKSKITVQKEIDEFINEVAILSQIHHRNVVKLIGCCLETEVPLLVYEFISNGTLYHHLHIEGPKSLSWVTRLRVAAETASALAYLHSSVSIPIIHRDIKSSNILLEDTMTSKVSDFGASRYIPIDKTGLTTMVQGTIGYLDPMYFYTGRLTEKSDVYSFGVILVELLTRKKPFSCFFSDGNGLVTHFVNLLSEQTLVQILDPQVIEEGGNEIEEVSLLAASCIKLTGDERPTMRQVEHTLERVLASMNYVKCERVVSKTNDNDTAATNYSSAMEWQSVQESSRKYSIEEEVKNT